VIPERADISSRISSGRHAPLSGLPFSPNATPDEYSMHSNYATLCDKRDRMLN